MSLTIEQALHQAIAYHQASLPQDAERLYRAILQAQPNHPEANHNLGVLALQAKQPDVALRHLKMALEANPNQGQYWLSYINALTNTGHLEAARQILRQARQRGLQGEAVEALASCLENRPLAIEQSCAEPHPIENASPSNLPTAIVGIKKRLKSKAGKSSKVVQNKKGRAVFEPNLKEIDKLMVMFIEGRRTEAEYTARSMTARFPKYGFGWKVLGVILYEFGRREEALEAQQMAVKLMPKDAEAHSNLGLNFRDLGRLAEGEASCRLALKLNPNYAEAHVNLGIALRDQGRLKDAEISYCRALEIRPEYFDAHNNLGNALWDQGRSVEAETSYRQALKIKPEDIEALNNLGNTLWAQGQLAEAEDSCRRALEINPNSVGVLYNLGNIYNFMGEMSKAAATYQKVLFLDPDNAGIKAAVWLAVLYFLEGDFEGSRNMLNYSLPIMMKTDAKHRLPHVYRQYLDQLLPIHQKLKGVIPQSSKADILHVIGESHSLSAHGSLVRYRGKEMVCNAHWISGCKQWHLGNSIANQYKHKFEAVMARLPRQSIVLLTIGEIDCRHDEGIIKASKKSVSKSLDDVALATASAYVSYVDRIATQYGHKIIVGGVPTATHSRLDKLTPETAGQLINLIRIFNAILKSKALTTGMDFLDVYAHTDRGDGVASGEWHIDSHHLLPIAITEAFGKHCIYTRNDFLHKTSDVISKNNTMVVIEDLKVANMSKSASGAI
jgi:tetratricopeptide (TPR) repeat protein